MGSLDRERNAALEAERARMRQAGAEVERDIATSAAINESAMRKSAENAAANERIRADMAESGARSASASARAAREDARDEHTAAGNATFVATIATLVALALIAVIGYYAWWQPNHTVDVHTNTIIEKSAPAPASQSTVPTVNVSPPRVNVNVENTPPASTGQHSDVDDNSSNQSDSGTTGENNSNGPGSGG